MAMLDELGRVSDEEGKLTRTFLSPAMCRANALVGEWMGAIGLTVREDPVGNLIGRAEGSSRRAKTLLLGSHLDSVRDAGKFDGPLGVLMPIMALAELQRRGVKLPFAVEVLGFSEEEGVRFASAYLGSEGYTGRLSSRTLELRDGTGVSVGDALKEWGGGRFSLPKAAHKRGELLGYVEVHIEQGPVLTAKKLAVGVVSAIAGQCRFKLIWTGKAGHAGTTPMALRRDALTGAAEFALAAEQLARNPAGLVATVGALTVSPGAANVIPGQVVHTLDVRHARDGVRREALFALGRVAKRIAKQRGLSVAWQRTQDNCAVECSVGLTALLERSVKAVQGTSLSLVCGAGHDGVVMAALTPVAMLFVRCRDGLSHHPDEYASPADLKIGLRVMVDFLERMAQQHAS